jgi:predicted transcriptional regulator
LRVLEKAGVVGSTMKKDQGPRRKEYFLRRSMTVSIDSAPCFFSVQGHTFDTISEDGRESKEGSQLLKRASEILGYKLDEEKISPYSRLLVDIDGKLASLRDNRTILLYIRNLVMRQAVAVVKRSDRNVDERSVLYHVLDLHNKSVPDILESLNLKASTVEKIVADLKDTI